MEFEIVIELREKKYAEHLKLFLEKALLSYPITVKSVEVKHKSK